MQLLGIISRALDGQEELNCSSYIVPLFCNYLFPPCNNESLPMRLCYDTCFNLTSGPCSSQWDRLYKLAAGSDILHWLLRDLDCSNTYYDANYADNMTCWNAETDINITTSQPEPTPPSTTTTSSNGGKHYQENLLMIVIALIIAFEVVLLLVFIVATLIMGHIFYKKRKSASYTFLNPNQSSIMNFP